LTLAFVELQLVTSRQEQHTSQYTLEMTAETHTCDLAVTA